MKASGYCVSGIKLDFNDIDEGIHLDSGLGCRNFLCSDSKIRHVYQVDLKLKRVDQFIKGNLIYEGLPWGDLQLPCRWFVENVDGDIAIKVAYDDHSHLNWAMALICRVKGVITFYFDVKKLPFYFDPFLYPLGILVHIYLVNFNHGMVIHASGVSDGDKGYLFTGLSGIGKSTMANLWKQNGASIVNDDRLVIMPNGNGFDINNTPMPYYIDVPKQSALNGIFLLKQSLVNTCKPISGATAMMRFMANSMQHLHTKEFIECHLNVIEAVLAKVPVFELGFKPDDEIVQLIRQLNL